jgi:hypothetical protein
MNESRKGFLSEAAFQFLSWVNDDFTELFVLRTVLKSLNGSMSPEAERATGLQAVKQLLDEDLVMVGEFRSDVRSLVYWEGTHFELQARIESIWSVERPPEMGEAPWFQVTTKGRCVAEGNLLRPRT